MKTPLQTTAANNAAFKKLNKSGKRVAIAEDVIARVKAKQYKPEQGVWAQPDIIVRGSSYDDARCVVGHDESASMQNLLKQNQTQCECYALGSLMLSCTVANNNVIAQDVADGVYDYSDIACGWTSDKMGLQETFSLHQLEMIETTFEEGRGYYSDDNENVSLSLKERNDCIAFAKRYRTPRTLLLAIMENIVDNKGTFKP